MAAEMHRGLTVKLIESGRGSRTRNTAGACEDGSACRAMRRYLDAIIERVAPAPQASEEYSRFAQLLQRLNCTTLPLEDFQIDLEKSADCNDVIGYDHHWLKDVISVRLEGHKSM